MGQNIRSLVYSFNRECKTSLSTTNLETEWRVLFFVGEYLIHIPGHWIITSKAGLSNLKNKAYINNIQPTKHCQVKLEMLHPSPGVQHLNGVLISVVALEGWFTKKGSHTLQLFNSLWWHRQTDTIHRNSNRLEHCQADVRVCVAQRWSPDQDTCRVGCRLTRRSKGTLSSPATF